MKSPVRGDAGAREPGRQASDQEPRVHETQRVLVGVDGSADVPRIIDAAFEVAIRTGSRIWLLDAVHAPDPGACMVELIQKRRAAMEWLLRRHPGAAVERLIVQAGPLVPLVTAAASLCLAPVLVIGAQHVRRSSSSTQLREAIVPWGGTLLVVCDRPAGARIERRVPVAL